MVKNRNSVLTFLTALLLFNTFVPVLGSLVQIVLMAFVIIWGVFSYPGIINSKPFKYMFFFILVELVYAFFGKGNPYKMVVFYSFFFFSSIVICTGIKELTKQQSQFLLYLFVGFLLFTFITTYLALLNDSMIIRNNAYSRDDMDSGPTAVGVYSYGVGEALAIILPALTAFAFTTKQRMLQIILFIVVLGGVVTQFIASLMTSALLSLVFCLLVVLASIIGTHNRIRWIVSLLLLALITIAFLPSINLDDNVALLMKMEDISESYSSGQSVGEVEGRASLYKQSIKVCLQHPFLGLGEAPSDFGKYKVNTVSMHTSFFDYWGFYGIFTLLLIISWTETIKKTYIYLSREKKRLYKWTFLSLIMLLVLKGPVTIGINFLFSTAFIAILFIADYNNENQLIDEKKNSNLGR